MTTETEVKFGAWAGFELPALDGVVDDVTAVARGPRTLLSVYYDTPDLRLPVARIRTVRTGVEMLDREGSVVAEVVDDEVSVLHGGRVGARFREVEVELGERTPPGLLDAVVTRLQAAGAGAPDSTPKVVRALGARAVEPPEVAPPTLGKHPSAAELLRRALTASVARIMRHDPGVRVGDDPEDVHQARVGTRPLRSDLRTFAPLVDAEWASSLDGELRWLGGGLGAVVLGEYQDAVVAESWLRSALDGVDQATSLAAGELIGVQIAEAAAARKRWPKAWKKAADKKLRSWL